MKRLRVVISGRVQGVFFRAETKRTADALSVNGWVRNLADGRVEAVFEGSDEALQSILRWCRKGPPQARVDDIAVNWQDSECCSRGFQIRY